jgi:membrane fusion protein, multidrug efflux system
MKHKHYWLTLVLALLLSACDKPVEEKPIVKPVLVMQVGAAQTSTKGLVLTGEVKTRYASEIGFRIAGKIVKRYVEVGEQVKKGQLLATIDAQDASLNAMAASADVRAAEANHHLAEVELARKKQLYQEKFISKSALDAQIATFQASLAQLKQTKSQAAVSSNQTVYTRLLADRAGIIADINAEPGQVVAPGQFVARVIDTNTLEVEVPMPESHIGRLHIGDVVKVKLWADVSKQFEGKVREIAPAANEQTRAFTVLVSILNPDNSVKIGMTAGVKFDEESASKMIIPNAAVTAKNNQALVWIVNNGIAQPKAVKTGNFTEDGVEILEGINQGDVIAVAGVHTLLKGQHVKPMFDNSNRKY